jgi:hypothetical protein
MDDLVVLIVVEAVPRSEVQRAIVGVEEVVETIPKRAGRYIALPVSAEQMPLAHVSRAIPGIAEYFAELFPVPGRELDVVPKATVI